jgi:hypothetical protein
MILNPSNESLAHTATRKTLVNKEETEKSIFFIYSKENILSDRIW